jgi:hypothetical protein
VSEKILLINPIKRKAAVKRRPHSKTGVKKMAKAKRKPVAKRRKNPIMASANPIKKRRRHHARKNPIGNFRKRARRSAATGAGIVNHMVMPAVTAAAGALLSDVLYSNLPIPANLKNGVLQYVVKAGLAVAMVKGVHMVTKNKAQAEKMGVGALTILLHDMGRNAIKRSAPGLRIGEYVGEYVGEYDGLGEYVGAGGGLDFDAPLGFYETAGQGSNMVPNFPNPNAAAVQQVHGFDDGIGEYGDSYDYDM